LAPIFTSRSRSVVSTANRSVISTLRAGCHFYVARTLIRAPKGTETQHLEIPKRRDRLLVARFGMETSEYLEGKVTHGFHCPTQPLRANLVATEAQRWPKSRHNLEKSGECRLKH
jgi:hypothetical protein